MNRGIVTATIFLVIVGMPILHAADDSKPSNTCADLWNRLGDRDKSMFVTGYMNGSLMAAEAAEAYSHQSGLARELRMYFWPEKYRVGAVVLEIDVSCDIPANRDKMITSVLFDIAVDKNAAFIKKEQKRIDR